MTIGEFYYDGNTYLLGECPEIPPMPAPGVVDAPLPTQSDAGGSSNDPTIAAAFEALDSLVSENADLRTKLARAEQARDTSQAQLAHYRRTGW